MIQVKLMNLITSFTSFPTIVIRLIAIQVLRNYFQPQLSYNVQCNIYKSDLLQCNYSLSRDFFYAEEYFYYK